MLDTHSYGTPIDQADPNNDPPDQLARAFIEQLRQEERTRIKRDASYTSALDGVAIDDEDDPVERIVSRNEAGRQVEYVPVPADRAAVAILVARAIEEEPGLLRRLRREAPWSSSPPTSENLSSPPRPSWRHVLSSPAPG